MADDEPEENTLVTCQACGGHYELREKHDDGTYTVLHVCPWCTEGNMSRKQGLAWARLHRIGGKSGGC